MNTVWLFNAAMENYHFQLVNQHTSSKHGPFSIAWICDKGCQVPPERHIQVHSPVPEDKPMVKDPVRFSN